MGGSDPWGRVEGEGGMAASIPTEAGGPSGPDPAKLTVRIRVRRPARPSRYGRSGGPLT
ncbi:hypothetical protein Srufu_040570 [Streptomyces libani subsp. rufus]|nr:hypothetical protein Srufu_040570 [Streptomyces libani subsp. rufus]